MSQSRKTLLVGPLPPPPDGTSVSFDLFCDEAVKVWGEDSVWVVDSSPGYLKEKSSVLGVASIVRSLRILRAYLFYIGRCDRVILFGSTGFLLSMAPLLLLLARLMGKRCWIRAFGGSLDIYEARLHPLALHLLRATLNRTDGVIVQTAWLQNYYGALLDVPILKLPGYRRRADDPIRDDSHREPGTSVGPLRLIYVGHVRAEKGVFELIRAVEKMTVTGNFELTCHIFGPIYPSIRQRFQTALAQCESVVYGGVLSPEQVIPTLRTHDLMVFPSYYEGEGHPGVIIEAMFAGLPIVATHFRSIPEVVEEGVNGLLVPPEDSDALAAAIERMACEPELYARCARGSRSRSQNHDVEQIVPALFKKLTFPPAQSGLEIIP